MTRRRLKDGSDTLNGNLLAQELAGVRPEQRTKLGSVQKMLEGEVAALLAMEAISESVTRSLETLVFVLSSCEVSVDKYVLGNAAPAMPPWRPCLAAPYQPPYPAIVPFPPVSINSSHVAPHQSVALYLLFFSAFFVSVSMQRPSSYPRLLPFHSSRAPATRNRLIKSW